MAMNKASLKEALEREQKAREEAEAIKAFYENKWRTKPLPTVSPAARYTQSEDEKAAELREAERVGRALVKKS